jgi:hypothetical protein
MSKKQAPVTRFRILTLAWSAQHGRYLEPGEIVEFDFSEEAENKPDYNRLITKGVAEVYNGEWPIPEPAPEIITEVENA